MDTLEYISTVVNAKINCMNTVNRFLARAPSLEATTLRHLSKISMDSNPDQVIEAMLFEISAELVREVIVALALHQTAKELTPDWFDNYMSSSWKFNKVFEFNQQSLCSCYGHDRVVFASSDTFCRAQLSSNCVAVPSHVLNPRYNSFLNGAVMYLDGTTVYDAGLCIPENSNYDAYITASTIGVYNVSPIEITEKDGFYTATGKFDVAITAPVTRIKFNTEVCMPE